jgi:hypothetical protein
VLQEHQYHAVPVCACPIVLVGGLPTQWPRRLAACRQYAAVTGFSLQFAWSQQLVANSIVVTCLWASIKFLANPGK